MKRFSIYFLFAICTWLALTAFDVLLTRHELIDYYQRDFAKMSDRISPEGDSALALWTARGNVDDLQSYLETRRKISLLDFWAINGPNIHISAGLKDHTASEMNFDYSFPHGSILKRGNLYYETEELGNGTNLVVGKIYNVDYYLAGELHLNWLLMIRSIAGGACISFLVFFYFFKDIRATIIRLRDQKTPHRAAKGSSSREADVLARGLSAFDSKANLLEAEKNLFSWQVLPSLRTELTSGRAPPYEFACTLVRTDINNFSKIYNESPVEEFAATLNDFFTEASHIVARYGGLVHEFVGDEVLFYFKDDEVGNSPARALSALRDINEAAVRIHKMTLKERGYPFTVKSSFAHGRLRFGKFVNAYSLAGPVLIETVRILSAINEKDGNVVVFDSRHLAQVEIMAQTQAYADVRLKGFPDERKLFNYVAHHPIARFIASSDAKAFNCLEHFRSDADLSAILAWARESAGQSDPVHVFRTLGMLRRITVTQTSGIPQQHLLLWIEDLLRQFGNGASPSEHTCKTLASALRLIENLVPSTELSHQFEVALKNALEIKDRRVIANALDVLAQYQHKDDALLGERFARHPDNRVAANAIVLEGRRGITPFVVKRLQKMLSCRNSLTMSSALYAVGEIASHHRKKDSVYYSTQLDFLKMVDWIPTLSSHDDVMVRRQALIAAAKIADHEMIRDLIASAQTPERDAELRAYLGAFMSEVTFQAVKKSA